MPLRRAWLLIACTAVGCGSSEPPGDASSSASGAELRFRYRADWNARLGCTSVSNYRIKFGAIPIAISIPIDVTDNSLGAYAIVDGRPYVDADVLHIYTCNTTSKQEFGRLGLDLPLAPFKRYTVTLNGLAATIAEDP